MMRAVLFLLSVVAAAVVVLVTCAVRAIIWLAEGVRGTVQR